ncbi:MAG TPA: sulfotransferase [Frateuria sp.]|uniref:tetratricopeptide repeat-containing sulfotransferase family protein n=1 Tax=Frateuria sp. TaxID=2211372 RepID=UPI002D7F6A10|nr:sulfotransferase [Frateuria sp.]HET6804836.1 sulfotransferase [Frateuria sp.]
MRTAPIVSAFQQGDWATAERLSVEALQASPSDPDLLLLRALALHQQGRLEDAIDIYGELAHLVPGSHIHWGNYATALLQAGRLDEADQASATALGLAPESVERLITRGLVKIQQRAFIEARDLLLKASEGDPRSAAARIHAARACLICRDYRAEDLLRPWRDWLPLEPALQLELADLKLQLGDARVAQALLEDLLAHVPSHASARLLLAAVYERMSRNDAARAQLDALAADAVFAEANRVEIEHQYAMLELRSGDAAGARQLLEQAGPRHPGDYAHYFTLAEVCDKLGDHDAALQALQSAHALQVEELKAAVPTRFEPDAPLLPAAVGRVSSEQYRSWPTLEAPAREHSPVFIVGYPRSGTTLLEQMLDAHPTLQSMDERPFFNVLADRLGEHGIATPGDLHRLDQQACDELRRAYMDLVCGKIQRRWSARLVDKNPLNMLWVPLIHRLFPNAQFILALRHPCDVLVSNYMQNFHAGILAAASESFERLAHAYVTAMQAWLAHVDVFAPSVFVSRYEDLVADPQAQTGRIAAFLGLEDASPMLRFDQHARDKGFIATPSYAQVIRPINRSGLGRWLRYRDALAPALPILAPMLQHWGYAVDAAGE